MRLVKHLESSGTARKWNTPLSNYACAVRPVAAIMVTKFQDFSELVDQDQDAGMLLLSKSYKLQEYYFNHHGCTRMVKMGDTVLASFYSVESAVKCAIKIQRGAQKMFNYKLQIGIHMGEVRYVDSDLFGSPVNIASDIQGLALPGQVLVSEPVAQSLDREQFAIGLERTSQNNAFAIFEVKSRITEKTSYIGYADSVDTRDIDHQGGWGALNIVSAS